MISILVIDDDAQMLLFMEAALSQAGHAVRVASNGLKGIQACRKERFDLVITDLFMPEKEGLETIRELKTMHAQVKILAISGGTPLLNQDFLPLARQLGAHGVLAKPFGRRDLLAEVERILGEVD